MLQLQIQLTVKIKSNFNILFSHMCFGYFIKKTVIYGFLWIFWLMNSLIYSTWSTLLNFDALREFIRFGVPSVRQIRWASTSCSLVAVATMLQNRATHWWNQQTAYKANCQWEWEWEWSWEEAGQHQWNTKSALELWSKGKLSVAISQWWVAGQVGAGGSLWLALRGDLAGCLAAPSAYV